MAEPIGIPGKVLIQCGSPESVSRSGDRRTTMEDGMNGAGSMDWKRFTIRLIEALRWPAAFIAVAVIFREPLTQFVSAISQGVSN